MGGAERGSIVCMSAILLVDLVFNALLGWSWADPVAALIIAAVAVREGVEAWRGEQCEDCSIPTSRDEPSEDSGCGTGCTEACCTGPTGEEAADR